MMRLLRVGRLIPALYAEVPMQSIELTKSEEKLHMGWICRYAKSISACQTKDLCQVILEVNVTLRSRMRERHTYGSVRGLRREPLVYSAIGINSIYILLLE